MTVTPFDYAETLADADELIEEFGRSVSVRKVVASGTAWEPTLTPTDTATYAVRTAFTLAQLQSGNVLETDERWLVAAGPLGAVVPGATDKLLIASVAVPIVRVDPLNPAGTVILYDCQLRF